jgi:rod shape-determining protein MreC
VSFRDGPFNDLKVPLTWTAAVAVIVAIVVGVAFLLADRRETLQSQAYGVGRKVFDQADKPVADVLSAPSRWLRDAGDYMGSYFFAAAENRRLKAEVVELRKWRDNAIALEDTNRRYKAILGLKTDPPIPMITGRVVLDSRGPFANTRLANVGSEAGVKVGNPVMNERGLVGRVVGVTHGVSRILLLTDVASRTPVLVDRTDARAILTGDGGSNPRLSYLRGQDPVKEGDRILTSGDGGVFPRGLPVGVAAKGLDGQWRVRLAADTSAIDFVRFLMFQDFTALVNEKELENTAMPPLAPSQKVRAPTVSVASAETLPASGAAAAKAAAGSAVAKAPASTAAAASRSASAASATKPPVSGASARPPRAASTSAVPSARTTSAVPRSSARSDEE